MKISYNWLKKYIQTELEVNKIGSILTDLGLEVEGISAFPEFQSSLEGVVVGEVMSCEKAPNSDKLHLTQIRINAAGDTLSVICGAPNVRSGLKVAVATEGTKLFTAQGEEFEIKKSKIRGHVSEGMLCSEVELGVGKDNSGIMELPPHYEVGKNITDYIEIRQDKIFEIGLTPNRTDAMGHLGVARDLAAYIKTHQLGGEFIPLNHQPDPSIDKDQTDDWEIQIQDEGDTPRYAALIIDNIEVKDSPDWLKFALHSIGLEPKNNIVDITNYILHSLGQPLHAFDANSFADKKIIVGTGQEGQKIQTLDGKDRILSGEEILISNNSGDALCIAGVMGGSESGVKSTTKSIVIESAYFNPVKIRKAAKKHAINSDASFRFERGTDPDMVLPALYQAFELIKADHPEITASLITKGNFTKAFHPRIILRFSKLDQVTGTIIHREQVKNILKYLDISIENEIANGLEVLVPAYRADVTREIDVIEEILRVYGYNKIVPGAKINYTPAIRSNNDPVRLENKIADALAANGFNEIMNNSLCHIKEADETTVELLNPLSSDLKHMRNSLLQGHLESISFNVNRKQTGIRFFEIGNVYFKNADKKNYAEQRYLGISICGKADAHWDTNSSLSLAFYQLKTEVQKIFQICGLNPTERQEGDTLIFSLGSETMGTIRKLDQATLRKFDIKEEVVYAELNLSFILPKYSLREKISPISKVLGVTKDMAFILDKDIPYSQVEKISYEAVPGYLKNISLFDIYEGEKIGADKKSYAMSFDFLDEEKTMEDSEISGLMNTIIQALEEKIKAKLRN